MRSSRGLKALQEGMATRGLECPKVVQHWEGGLGLQGLLQGPQRMEETSNQNQRRHLALDQG